MRKWDSDPYKKEWNTGNNAAELSSFKLENKKLQDCKF